MGKLALAGPFDGVDGWRGLFIFAVADIAEAQALVATDPVIIKGEMVAEYHAYYGSAALMLVRDAHEGSRGSAERTARSAQQPAVHLPRGVELHRLARQRDVHRHLARLHERLGLAAGRTLPPTVPTSLACEAITDAGLTSSLIT